MKHSEKLYAFVEAIRRSAVAAAGTPTEPVEAERIKGLAETLRGLVVDALATASLVSGLRVPVRTVRVGVVDARAWAKNAVLDCEPLFVDLFSRLEPLEHEPAAGTLEGDDEGGDLVGAVGRLKEEVLGTVDGPSPSDNTGSFIGGFLGTIAQHAMGQFDAPVPRSDRAKFILCPPNIEGFASSCGVDIGQALRWAVWHDVVRYLILAQPAPRAAMYTLGRLDPAVLSLDASMLEAHLKGIGETITEARRVGRENHAELWLRRAAPLETEASLQICGRQAAVNALMSAEAWLLAARRDQIFMRLTEALTAALAKDRRERPLPQVSSDWWFGWFYTTELYDRALKFLSVVDAAEGNAGLLRIWATADTLPRQDELSDPHGWLRRVGALAPAAE
jgi:uncharacterized protein (DUF2342 family)